MMGQSYDLHPNINKQVTRQPFYVLAKSLIHV